MSIEVTLEVVVIAVSVNVEDSGGAYNEIVGVDDNSADVRISLSFGVHVNFILSSVLVAVSLLVLSSSL